MKVYEAAIHVSPYAMAETLGFYEREILEDLHR